MTDNADSKSINLAQRISDEALVYVPTKEEVTSQEAHSNASNTKENKKANLNKASLEELKQVKGLGAKRAQDIIDHRESNGKFKSVDELKKGFWYWCKNDRKVKRVCHSGLVAYPSPKSISVFYYYGSTIQSFQQVC